MNLGNIVVLFFVFVCICAIAAYLFCNLKKFLIDKGITTFVMLNHLVLLGGIGAYMALYHWEIFWLWKGFLAVLLFDVILGFIMLVRNYVSEHYYDSLDIQDGVLKKVYGSEYLRILKLPKECVKIDDNAFVDLKELEEIYFGKNVEFVSEKTLENHYTLHTLHFANPETKYEDSLKDKYKIKQK